MPRVGNDGEVVNHSDTISDNHIQRRFNPLNPGDDIHNHPLVFRRDLSPAIAAARFALANDKPYLGICLGLQVAVIAAARRSGLAGANSTEFDADTTDNVVYIMDGQQGKESTGGKNGTLTNFKRQIQALAACHLTLGFYAAGRAYTYNGQPVKQFEAWITPRDEHQRALWPGVVTFSEDYYQSLVDHAVPQDVRAMYALKGSALAMDVYAMLSERLHRIGSRPVVLHWASLREQFGQEYGGADPDKDFKKAFLTALKKVLAVYPKADVRQVHGGLMLLSSPPPVPYKG